VSASVTDVRRTVVVAGLLLSLVFGYLAVRHVDLDGLRAALAAQKYAYLVPAGLALAAGVAVRAWRWQLLFERSSRPPFRFVANALLVGYLFNTILPARAGELARVHVLGRRAGISRAQVLGTVLLERIYDVVVLIALLAVAAPFLPPVGWLKAALVLGAALAVALVAVAVFVRRHGEPAARMLLRPLFLLPMLEEQRVHRIAAGAVAGLAAIRITRLALAAVFVTAASWLLLAVSGWFLLLGTEIDAGFEAALLVLIATNLVLVLPSSPAGIGTFEAAAVLALAPYGINREQALSYALVLHALNALPYVAVGYFALATYLRTVSRPRAGPAPPEAS
jgi:uncharacterized protein (TIRG00374 family)